MKMKKTDNFTDFKYLYFEVRRNEDGVLDSDSISEMQVRVEELLNNGFEICETYQEDLKNNKTTFHYVFGM